MTPTYNGLPVLSSTAAEFQGLVAMTNAYDLSFEADMLDRVIADMNRGSIKFALVQVGLGIEVWR